MATKNNSIDNTSYLLPTRVSDDLENKQRRERIWDRTFITWFIDLLSLRFFWRTTGKDRHRQRSSRWPYTDSGEHHTHVSFDLLAKYRGFEEPFHSDELATEASDPFCSQVSSQELSCRSIDRA